MTLADLGRTFAAMTDATAARYTAELDDDELAHLTAAIDAAEAEAGEDSAAARYARWWADPAAFAAEAFTWADDTGLHPYQSEALTTVATRRRLVLRKLHGVGGTAVAAVAVLWFALTRDRYGVDWKVVTTASVDRQLSEYLWPEIHKWAARLRWDALARPPWVKGAELLQTHIKLTHGSAFAATASDPAKIEGAHATQLFVVLDEAKTITNDVFDGLEGAFASSGPETSQAAYALALSTPGSPAGRFYELARGAPGTEDWARQHVTLAQALAAGQVSASWADARRRQWGAGSALYRNRVLGEFADDAADVVIPLSWVEAANERWRAATGTSFTPDMLGVDIGISIDLTVIAPMGGDLVAMPVRPALAPSETPLTQIAGHVAAMMGRHPGGPSVIIDADGIGAGVFEQLMSMDFMAAAPRRRCFAFHAGAKTTWRDRTGELAFDNTRAAAWWSLRDELDPDNGATLALPDDDMLTGDLTAPHWRYGRGGRILIESKDDLRKRIGRSTDTADSVVMGRWGRLMVASGVMVRAGDHRGAGGLTGDLLERRL